MRRFLLGLAAALFITPAAYPWGSEGHAAIGLLAEQRLTPAARDHVRQILGNDDLAAIGSWMDDVLGVAKGFGPLAGSREAHEFVRRYPHSNVWHYVDLPLGENRYRDDDRFSRPDDVVHELNIAIRVLEGKSDAVAPRVALYMVVHFVGDLHQPLHVACGYWDLSDPAHPGLITDPAQAVGHPDDAGANLLRYGPGRWEELHGYWDIVLPGKIAGSPDPAVLARKLAGEMRPEEWKTSGDHHGWAEQWATESILAARLAYAGLSFGPARMENGRLRDIPVTLPATYPAGAEDIAARRLAQAGYRLAELLNAIDWAPPAAPPSR